MSIHQIAVPLKRRARGVAFTPAYRMNIGVGLMVVSLAMRFSAAGLLVAQWGKGAPAVAAGAVYVAGKVLFYVGITVAGPAAVQRYPWLRRLYRARKNRNA